MHDLLIIGAGPAGLTAAIYGVRAGLQVLVIEKLSPGGQVMNTYEVENYPGFIEPVAGWDLMAKMEQQARRLGVNIENGDVVSVAKQEDNGQFVITLAGDTQLSAKSVIVASGSSLRQLQVPGEKEFTGRGVSYCATCDGAFFKDKTVAVVGGGDTALEEAHFLTRFAAKVYLVHRRDAFRGARILQDRVLSSKKIEPLYNTVVERINGKLKIESLTLRNVQSNESYEQPIDGVFIFVGYDPNTSYLPAEILTGSGEIAVDICMKTAIPGLFAAGDMRSYSKRQIVMAAADGATAAMEAYEYITHHAHGE